MHFCPTSTKPVDRSIYLISKVKWLGQAYNGASFERTPKRGRRSHSLFEELWTGIETRILFSLMTVDAPANQVAGQSMQPAFHMCVACRLCSLTNLHVNATRKLQLSVVRGANWQNGEKFSFVLFIL